MMRSLGVRIAKKTYPTGNPNFAVMQAFPAGFTAEEADPFLMCDYFQSTSKGQASHPDDFPVAWHPHKGQDICTYLKKGVGRHADSLGNRGTYRTPGMQWCTVGSGIEHAEGGGTPLGEPEQGFQLWLNVPADRKNDSPKYGTLGPELIPTLEAAGTKGFLLAGPGTKNGAEVSGPFKTVQPIQMIDWELDANISYLHTVPVQLDNCILYIYEGGGSINGEKVSQNSVVRLDATGPARDIQLSAGPEGLKTMCFAGKRLDQPIAWHGPFVLNTQAEIRETFSQYQRGQFPPIKAAWNYRNWADFPPEARAAHSEL